MTPNLSYQPVLRLTIKAAEDIPAYRLVDLTGHLSTTGGDVLGVSDYPVLAGELISLIVLGTAIISTSNTLNVGDKIISDDTGKAIITNISETPNGIVINSSVNYSEILLCK